MSVRGHRALQTAACPSAITAPSKPPPSGRDHRAFQFRHPAPPL